ncbi:hypothetical protein G6F62_014811 [Rhizopus arrhizus]|nr:hypothetical protein G6F62_014811 [Rhizopus arrhizus]
MQAMCWHRSKVHQICKQFDQVGTMALPRDQFIFDCDKQHRCGVVAFCRQSLCEVGGAAFGKFDASFGESIFGQFALDASKVGVENDVTRHGRFPRLICLPWALPR